MFVCFLLPMYKSHVNFHFTGPSCSEPPAKEEGAIQCSFQDEGIPREQEI